MKLKPTPTSPKARLENEAHDIESLYRENLKHIDQPARAPRMSFSALLLTLIFGFLAGIIGELVFNAYLIGDDSPLLRALRGENTSSVSQPSRVNESGLTPTLKTIAAVNEALLGVFEVRGGAGTVNGLYPQEAQLGTALILSDDGWAVTTRDVLAADDKEYAAVTNDKRVLAVKHRIIDPATNLVYFQIDGGNFPVVALAKPFDFLPMTPFTALASNPQRALQRERTVMFEQLRFLQGAGHESSDVLSRRMRIAESAGAAFRGGAVIDESGAVVGMISGGENGSTSVIPSHYISQVLVDLLRNETVVRPSIGIHYVDVATMPGIPETQRFMKNAGALVIESGDVPAIQPRSAAEEAGVRGGDLIIQVNQEDLTELKGLNDVLQSFHPDDVITLTLIRDGAQKSIEVVVEKLIE